MVSVLKNITNLFTIFGDIAFYGKSYGTGVPSRTSSLSPEVSLFHKSQHSNVSFSDSHRGGCTSASLPMFIGADTAVGIILPGASSESITGLECCPDHS
jgi:hypothetical protein